MNRNSIGEAFEEVVENLDEFEYPCCYLNSDLDFMSLHSDPDLNEDLPW